MKVHLIAIGGSAMHNMALALKSKGYQVSGSDDAIFEPSKSRLQKEGLLPSKLGWDDSKIDDSIDAIILGMHAKIDNPELIKAQSLGIPIYSYPEYIYNQCVNKKRVVIGGSHGKTSITAMILHVFAKLKIDVDYMVGAQLDGFDRMVKLSKDANIVILEGDEYLSSPIDRRPKFHWYKPHIAVLSGLAWDHINVFPTFNNYIEQFQIFKNDIENVLFYYQEDDNLVKLAKVDSKCKAIPYSTHESEIIDGITFLIDGDHRVPLKIFGEHNLQNLKAAQLVCLELGVSISEFNEHIQSFNGASKRLELVKRGKNSVVFKDFAHSPSKLKATTSAMKKQFSDRHLVACMELHTFSSLNKEFLKQYSGSMNEADTAIVFFSKKAIEHKKIMPISEDVVFESFKRSDLKVFTDSKSLVNYLTSLSWDHKNLLMMSSGNFDGINFDELAQQII